jgi:Ca-activated chloride channel family protein
MIYEWYKAVEFAYPAVLLLLVLLPVWIGWYASKYRSRQGSVRVSTVKAFHARSFRNYMMHLPFALRILAAACIIIAMARPRESQTRERKQGEGIDIVLSMDVSGSMLSQDFRPNRLEVAKNIAVDFITNRPVDRIGLVIFSGESFTMSPLTTDKNSLVSQVESLRSGMLKDGTLIGEGLATAVARLMDGEAGRVIILLTDGREEAPDTRLIDPLSALEIARARGVKVYTIGMSAQQHATISENIQGRRVTPALLDEDLLRRIAESTGGAYFRARDETDLREIYREIDQLEKSDFEIISSVQYSEQFQVPLAAAMVLLLLEFLLRFLWLRRFP